MADFRSKARGLGCLLIFFAAFYLALCGLVYFEQESLLFLPRRSTLAQTSEAAAGLALWPQVDDRYRALLADQAAPRATAVVFHGNAGDAANRSYYADALGRRGWRVLLAEYPGYGARGEKLDGSLVVDDAVATLREAHRQFGEPLIVIGESLGAGVAAAAVARAGVPVRGVALITPWYSLTELARRRFSFLPVRLLIKEPYESRANLERWGGKVAIWLAEHDEVIPTPFGQRLYDELANPKTCHVFVGRGHNDWPKDPEEAWWSELVDDLLPGG